jgi:hypothetical protein
MILCYFVLKFGDIISQLFCSKLSLIDNPVILNDLMREFGNKSWWWEFGPNIKLNYFKKNILEKLLFVESQVATSYNSVIIESP